MSKNNTIASCIATEVAFSLVHKMYVCCQITFLGVMMTDKTTPSSSSAAVGEATKMGSDGYKPG